MVFISVECVFILAVFALHQFYPKLFLALGDDITKDGEIIKWLPVVPLALSAYCWMDLAWKLLTPLASSNKELHDWPDFWRLKMRCYFSLVLSVLYAASACCLWIFSKNITHDQMGFLFILLMGLSLINISCVIFASFTLRIIMEKEDKSNG
jgi:hypothetical protein